MEPPSPHEDARLREIRSFIKSARRVYRHDRERPPRRLQEQRHDTVLAWVTARFGGRDRVWR